MSGLSISPGADGTAVTMWLGVTDGSPTVGGILAVRECAAGRSERRYGCESRRPLCPFSGGLNG